MNRTPAPLRVAQLVETLESGGAEALAVDIAGALAARGHVSHLIVANGDGAFRQRVAPDVHFRDLERPRRDGNQVYRILYFLETCRRLEALLRSQRIDVVQTHLPKANFLGLAMGWRGVCRVFSTTHNNREFDYGDRAGPLKRRLRRAGYRRMLVHCRGMIAVSGQVKKSLGEQLNLSAADEARIHVVPNGVKLPGPRSGGERRAARAAWGVQDDEILIVGVGRLTPQKNFGALLDALSRLSSRCGRWRCIIAGEGELRPELERQLAETGCGDRVRLAGLVAEVPALLGAADVFCLPSRFEGLPLVLLEAMGSGLPTAAFAIDGVTDVVADGVHARLVRPDDIDGLSAALGALIDDESLRTRLGSAARELVASRYGFDAMIDQLEKVYRS